MKSKSERVAAHYPMEIIGERVVIAPELRTLAIVGAGFCSYGLTLALRGRRGVRCRPAGRNPGR
jgi:hypothetical protein